jgi:Skp family chaperone for outer membrane proteins
MIRSFWIGLAVLGLVVAGARAEGEKREAKPLLVGVVDIGVVFKGFKKKDDLEKQVNATKSKYEAEALEQQAELEGLRTKIQRADDEDKPGLESELRAKVTAFKAQRDGWELELKREIERLTLAILEDIDNAVRVFAKENSFDLILKTDSKGWGDERYQERIFRAQVTTVIYRSDSLDVTKEILERLNAKVKKEAPK